MEQRVTFSSSGLLLEGLFDDRGGVKGVVVLHPHPLYGGEMGNPVVETVVQVYGRRGWSTLRFNFRGVGTSQGRYDNGDGEQDDVRAALRFLMEKGVTTLHLIGYSFGAWVLARMATPPQEVSAQILISPPIALLPLPEQTHLPCAKLVVTAENDEFAPPGLVKRALTGWNPEARLVVLDDADHFYFGSFHLLEQVVAEFLFEEGGNG